MAKKTLGFAVAVVSTDGVRIHHEVTFILARGRQEAKGMAVTVSLRERPDFAIQSVIAIQVPPLPTEGVLPP